MRRDKPSSKQSSPTTWYERPIAYDREIFIAICRRLLQGEDLKTICAKPPMPIGPVFLGWVQDHEEAREIYRSVRNFQSDRWLAKELDVAWTVPSGEWEEQVRANLQRGWPVDYIDRKYIPPDWNKVYPSLGGPPVWSTENMEAYNNLINGFTQMLEPHDEMELIWTKEATDATWEAGRTSRQKALLAERRYRKRVEAQAECARVLAQKRARPGQGNNEGPDLAAIMAKTPTGDDLDRGLEAGFKYYQALDIAQSRAIKRRDNALRQIARWRDGLGGKARALSDKFVAEQALAERYGVADSLDGEIDDTAGEATEAAPPLAHAGEAGEATPPLRASDEAAEAAPAVASSGEAAEAALPIALADEAAKVAPPLAPAEEEPNEESK